MDCAFLPALGILLTQDTAPAPERKHAMVCLALTRLRGSGFVNGATVARGVNALPAPRNRQTAYFDMQIAHWAYLLPRRLVLAFEIDKSIETVSSRRLLAVAALK